tara:strand:+ start:262 stop:486 length:225 start_codon:yes stop_codon:yes gene_type:complete
MEEKKIEHHQRVNKKEGKNNTITYLLIGGVAVVLIFSIVQFFQINSLMGEAVAQGAGVVGQAVKAAAPAMVGGC